MKQQSTAISVWLCFMASSLSAKTEMPFDEQCRSASQIVVATLTDVEQRVCVWTDSLETTQGLNIRDYVFHRGTLVIEKNLKGGSVTIDVTWGTIEVRGNVPKGPHGQAFESGQRGIWLIWDRMEECEMLPRISFESLERLEEVGKAFEEADSVIVEPRIFEGEELSKAIRGFDPQMHFAKLGPAVDSVAYRVSLTSGERSHMIVVDRIRFGRADSRSVVRRMVVGNFELSRRTNWPFMRYLSVNWIDHDRFQVDVDNGVLDVRIDGEQLRVRRVETPELSSESLGWKTVEIPIEARECAQEFLENWKPVALRGEFKLNGKEHLADGAELRGSYLECRLWEDDLQEYVESDVLDPTEFGYSFFYVFPIYSKHVFLGALRVARRSSPDGTRIVYRASGLSDLQPQAVKRAGIREAVESTGGRFVGFVGFRAGPYQEYAIIDTPDERYFLPFDPAAESSGGLLDLKSMRLNAIALKGMGIVKARVEVELREARSRRQ